LASRLVCPFRKSSQTDVSTELSSALSESVNISFPLDGAAQIQKLPAPPHYRESAQGFIHNLGLRLSLGDLHGRFERFIVNIECGPDRQCLGAYDRHKSDATESAKPTIKAPLPAPANAT